MSSTGSPANDQVPSGAADEGAPVADRTRDSWPRERKILWWTAAGVVLALLGVWLAWAHDRENDSPQINIRGSGNIQVNGDDATINNYQDFQKRLQPGWDAERAKAVAATFADVNPQGSGPWPFIVTDTGMLGLKIRSSGELSGRQIGSAANGETVWVDCMAMTSFTPPGGDNVGPKWAKIRWPNRKDESSFLHSSPSDRHKGWGYSGNLVPAGHNGKIPSCH